MDLLIVIIILLVWIIYTLFFGENRITGKRAYAEGLGKWLLGYFIFRFIFLMIERYFEVERFYSMLIALPIFGVIYLIFNFIRSIYSTDSTNGDE